MRLDAREKSEICAICARTRGMGNLHPWYLIPRQILRRVTTFYRGVLPVIFPALASFRRFETGVHAAPAFT